MRTRRPSSLLALCFVPALLGLSACSDGDDDASLEPDSGTPPPAKSSSGQTAASSGQPNSSGGGSSSSGPSSSSSGGDDGSGSGESSSSSGESSSSGGSLHEPEPGTACTVFGEQFHRPCEECGNQLAYCMQNGTVSGYGACEPTDACAGSSSSGGSSSGDGGSSSSGGSSSGGAPSPLPTLQVPAAGSTAELALASRGARSRIAGASASGTCPTSVDADEQTQHAFVEVINAGAEDASLELWLRSNTDVDSNLAVFAEFPATDADALQCVGKTNNACSAVSGLACLAGSLNRVTVPAGGRVVVYAGLWSDTDDWPADMRLHVGHAPPPLPILELEVPALHNDTRVQLTPADVSDQPASWNGYGFECPGSDDSEPRLGRLIAVHNGEATAVTVAVGATEPMDTVMLVYPDAPPLADDLASVHACNQYNDTCSSSNIALFDGPDLDSCATGITIPAGGTVWVNVLSYYDDEPWSDTEVLVRRTQ